MFCAGGMPGESFTGYKNDDTMEANSGGGGGGGGEVDGTGGHGKPGAGGGYATKG